MYLKFRRPKKSIGNVCWRTIQNLGSLLSAYDVSSDGVVFLKRQMIGENVLARAFDRSESCLPYAKVNLVTGSLTNNNWVSHGGTRRSRNVCTYIVEAGRL